MTPQTTVEVPTPPSYEEAPTETAGVFSDITGAHAPETEVSAIAQYESPQSEVENTELTAQVEAAATQITVTEASEPVATPETQQEAADSVPQVAEQATQLEPAFVEQSAEASLSAPEGAPALSDAEIVDQAVGDVEEAAQTPVVAAASAEQVKGYAWILDEYPIHDEYGNWTAADLLYIEQKLQADKAESSQVLDTFEAAVSEAGNKLETALRGLQGFDDKNIDSGSIFELAEQISPEEVQAVALLVGDENATIGQIFGHYKKLYLQKHATTKARYAAMLEGFLEQVKHGQAPGQSKKVA